MLTCLQKTRNSGVITRTPKPLQQRCATACKQRATATGRWVCAKGQVYLVSGFPYSYRVRTSLLPIILVYFTIALFDGRLVTRAAPSLNCWLEETIGTMTRGLLGDSQRSGRGQIAIV